MLVTTTSVTDRHRAGRGGPPAAAAPAQHPLRRRSSGAAKISRCSCLLLLLFAVLAAAPAVVGQVTVKLDFEGVGNGNPVGNFYAGGGGGPSKDYGITFGGGGICEGAVDNDEGGTWLLANEPSASTVAYIVANRDNIVFVAVSGGFTAMSFQYSTDWPSPNVTVYDGPDLTGNVLGTATFPATGLCGINGIPACGDPTGAHGRWPNVTVPFSGVARSARFASILFVDDMLITLAPPPTTPPTTQRPRRLPTSRPTRFPTKAPMTSACRPSRKGGKGNVKGCMKKKKMMMML